MSMDKDYDFGIFYFYCDGDGCDAEIVADVDDDFDAAMEELANNGWVSRKEGDWFHYCPDCA